MIFTTSDAEVLIDIVRKSRSMQQAIDRASRMYPEYQYEIARAVEKFFVEERVKLDDFALKKWREFSGGFIRLSELEKKIHEFCVKHSVDEDHFWKWFEGATTIKPKINVTAESLARYINYLRMSRIVRRAYKVVLITNSDSLGYVYKRIIFLNRGRDVVVTVDTNKNKVIIEAKEKSIVLAPIIPLAERVILFTKKGKFGFTKNDLGYEVEIKLFDSKWEKILYDALTHLGVRIRRDIPIDLGDRVFIVDFSVCINGKCVYLELVGYWRENYLINKEIKIRRALKNGYVIWVVIHERVKSRFTYLATRKYSFKTKKDLVSIASQIIGDINSENNFL